MRLRRPALLYGITRINFETINYLRLCFLYVSDPPEVLATGDVFTEEALFGSKIDIISAEWRHQIS
jgi:hypothetical protein